MTINRTSKDGENTPVIQICINIIQFENNVVLVKDAFDAVKIILKPFYMQIPRTRTGRCPLNFSTTPWPCSSIAGDMHPCFGKRTSVSQHFFPFSCSPTRYNVCPCICSPVFSTRYSNIM